MSAVASGTMCYLDRAAVLTRSLAALPLTFYPGHAGTGAGRGTGATPVLACLSVGFISISILVTTSPPLLARCKNIQAGRSEGTHSAVTKTVPRLNDIQRLDGSPLARAPVSHNSKVPLLLSCTIAELSGLQIHTATLSVHGRCCAIASRQFTRRIVRAGCTLTCASPKLYERTPRRPALMLSSFLVFSSRPYSNRVRFSLVAFPQPSLL